MFKKKTSKISNENSSTDDYKPSLTVPFEVTYQDENPKKMQKMKKEIEKQEKQDPTNPQNIFHLLNKNKKKNLKKLERSKSMPCIYHKDDFRESNRQVQFGYDVIRRHMERNIPLKDVETGEDIRPEFFTTYREFANVPYQTTTLRGVNLNRRRFVYFV